MVTIRMSAELFDEADKKVAHTSHISQPLDVAVFRHVKTVWRQALMLSFQN